MSCYGNAEIQKVDDKPMHWLQVTEPLEAEVIVRKISGRRVMFETVCRRSTDQAVLVDGAALARMQA